MATQEQIQHQIDMIDKMLPLASEITSQQLNKLHRVLLKYEAPLSAEQQRVFGKIERFVLKTSNQLLKSGSNQIEERSSSIFASSENSTPKESQPQANSLSPQPEPLPHLTHNIQQRDQYVQQLETEIVHLRAELDQMRLAQHSSDEAAMRIQLSEFEQQFDALQTKNKILQQQYEQQLRENMEKQRQIMELQRAGADMAALNERNSQQIATLSAQVAQLTAEQQNWQTQNIKSAKINDLFTTLQINLQQIEKTNKLVLDAQPKAMAALSQNIVQLKQQNTQLTEQLKDRVVQTNFELINEQIQKYQDYMPQVLANSRSQSQPEPYQQQTNLALEVSKICTSFKPRLVQLQRAGDKQWVYEKTGALLDIDFSDRGNVVITKEGGIDIKPVLLSQYLRSQVMGLSRSGSTVQSRSSSVSRSPSQGKALQLSDAKSGKFSYTSIRK